MESVCVGGDALVVKTERVDEITCAKEVLRNTDQVYVA